MARKRLPILHKVSNLLSISLLHHKLRKPIIPKLKKLRKRNEVEFLTHYNYGFIGDYQFSPSTTPLIHHYHQRHFKNRRYRDLCSFFYLYWCLGKLKGDGGGGTWECQLEAVPVPPNEEVAISVAEDLFDSGSGDEEGESVDQRAERFIERFYQEMRMQRQESI